MSARYFYRKWISIARLSVRGDASAYLASLMRVKLLSQALGEVPMKVMEAARAQERVIRAGAV